MSARGVAKIPKRIDSIKFSLMDPNEIRKMSAVEVKTADTYKDDGHAFKPVSYTHLPLPTIYSV